MTPSIRPLTLAAAIALVSPAAWAGEAWDEIRTAVIGDAATLSGEGVVTLTAPYRTADDRETPIAIEAGFEDGRTVAAVTFVIDENPMPVSLVYRPGASVAQVGFAANLRFDGPSPIRAIVEASDGQLYMSEAYVKTSGLGACASPPVTDPETALATLGDMELIDVTPAERLGAPGAAKRARLEISHPNLTGLQKDQITLQYILARYVDALEVRQGDELLFAMEAGISLSEDPEIEFDWRPNGAEALTVRITDTDGTVFERRFGVGAGS